MAKKQRIIITPINDDGTVGRAVVVTRSTKTDKTIEAFGTLFVTGIMIAIVLFVVLAAIEAY